MNQPYMVKPEIAALALNVPLSTLHMMVRDGVSPVPAHRIGKKLLRFKRPELEAFLGASLDEVLGEIA